MAPKQAPDPEASHDGAVSQEIKPAVVKSGVAELEPADSVAPLLPTQAIIGHPPGIHRAPTDYPRLPAAPDWCAPGSYGPLRRRFARGWAAS